MKAWVILGMILILGTTFPSFADTSWLEKFSIPLATNTPILWEAPANLPKSFWIYQRLPCRPFSPSVISNAVMLASVGDRGFPEPSTNAYFVWSPPDPCGVSFSIFSIQPAATSITFSSPHQNLSTNDVPSAVNVRKQALEYAVRFGVNPAYLISKDVYTASNATGCDQTLTEGVCARGIFLSRKLDGIGFFGDANNDSDGFSIEFGSRGQIRSFSLIWPYLETNRLERTASPQQIIACLRAHRTIVLPNPAEETYFKRLQALANAKKFTVTKITAYYSEGGFGNAPTNDVPAEFIAPFAELEAVADFGDRSATVQLISPILSSEVSRLLVNR
jgi:hypothetical protein